MTMKLIQEKGKAYITLDTRVQPVIHKAKLPSWEKPNHGWTKLNTDGAFVSCDDAGAGMILRDDGSGKIIFFQLVGRYIFAEMH